MEFKIGERFYIPYASIDEIPLEEFKNLHKKYWRFIADWRLIFKPVICSSITKKRISASKCFACMYAQMLQNINNYEDCACYYCPLEKYCTDIPEYMSWDKIAKYSNYFTAPNSLPCLALQVARINWIDRHNDMSYNGGE